MTPTPTVTATAIATLILVSADDLDHILIWMTRDGWTEDTPFTAQHAEECAAFLEQFHNTLSWPVITPIPIHFAILIEHIIEDWCEVLSNYDDEEPFNSIVEFSNDQ